MIRQFVSEEEGQTATEYMLLISVVGIALVVMGAKYVPMFSAAVEVLGTRVMVLLFTGRIEGAA